MAPKINDEAPAVEISVAKDGDNQAELVNYPVGSRIEVAGVLQFHKKGDALYLNLSGFGCEYL